MRWLFIWIREMELRIGGAKGRGGVTGKRNGGVEEYEMEERNRLERMHTQRRTRQNDLASRKREILREIERLKAEGSSSSSNADGDTDAEEMGYSFDLSEVEIRANATANNETYDIEAQPPRQGHPHQHSTTTTRIRQLQMELQELEDSPEEAHITSNIPPNITTTQPQRLDQKPLPRTPSLESVNLNSPSSGATVTDSDNEGTLVNASDERRRDPFTHPTLTNGQFNTPDSPSPLPRIPQYLTEGSQYSPTPRSRGGFLNGRGGALREYPNPNSRGKRGPNNQGIPNLNPSTRHQTPPRRISQDTWKYNDSDSENDIPGGEEGIFTRFAQRAREFEAGDPVPRRRKISDRRDDGSIPGPTAENITGDENVPDFPRSTRPGTPRVGDERRLANEYLEERRVTGESAEERRQEAGPVLQRPGNAHIPRETVGTFLYPDSSDEEVKKGN